MQRGKNYENAAVSAALPLEAAVPLLVVLGFHEAGCAAILYQPNNFQHNQTMHS